MENNNLHPYGFAMKFESSARKVHYNGIFVASDADFVTYWETKILRDDPGAVLLTFERLNDIKEVCS